MAVVSGNDVILTGLPRSGSTLTCEVLNAAEDTVALDEPIDNRPWTPPTPTALQRLLRRIKLTAQVEPEIEPDLFCRQVKAFFDDSRESLLAGTGARTRHVEGEVKGAKFLDGGEGLRKRVTKTGVIAFDKPLTPDFVLAVKHNAGFTAMLQHLAPRFRCHAIMRNPLATLASWQTVPIPIQRGRIPRGEKADRGLRATLDRTSDVLDRQFVILEWFFSRFRENIPDGSIIKYEDLVSSGGRALSVISPGAARLDAQLESRNLASVYDPKVMRRIGERLLDTDGTWWSYYTRDSVRELLASIPG